MQIRNPFKVPELAAMFAKQIELASDNFSEYYHGFPKDWGPRYPRTGAGHRCAFWAAYRQERSLYDGSRGGKGTYGYAAYRAGADFRKALAAR